MVQQRYGAVLKSMQRRHVECATQSDDVELLGGTGQGAIIGYGILASQHHSAGGNQQHGGNIGGSAAKSTLASSCASTQTPDWSTLSNSNESIKPGSGSTSPNNNKSFRHSHGHSQVSHNASSENTTTGSFRRQQHQQQYHHDQQRDPRSGSVSELSNNELERAGFLAKTTSSGDVAKGPAAAAEDEGHGTESKETGRLCSANPATGGLWDRHNGGQIISSSAGDVQL